MATRRRLRTLDYLLLGLLLPAWLLMFSLHVREVVTAGLRDPSVLASAGSKGDPYPRISATRIEIEHRNTHFELGDRILRIGDVDAAGLGFLGVHATMVGEADADYRVPVEIERDGEVRTLELELVPIPLPWNRIPALILFAVAAVIVLLRGSEAARPRLFFVAVFSMMLFQTPFSGGSTQQTLAYLVIFNGVGGFAIALAGLWFTLFPEELPARDAVHWGWPIAMGGLWAAVRVGYFVDVGIDPVHLPMLAGTVDALWFVFVVWVMGRNYRLIGPIGRRRMRWIVAGFALGVVPMWLRSVGPAVDPGGAWFPVAQGIGGVTLTAVPLGLLAAIVRYDAFDVDRLLSRAASITLLAVILAVVLVTGVPIVAEQLAMGANLDPVLARLLVAGCLVGVVATLGWRARQGFDELLFPERRALRTGCEALIRDLAEASSPGETMARLGRPLFEVVQPEQLALYARRETRADPDPFELVWSNRAIEGAGPQTVSALAAQLEERLEPVATVTNEERTDGARAGTFEDTPFVLLAPLWRGDSLAGFVGIGPKRSGDVYTFSDRSLIGRVAERASSQLSRFEYEDVMRDSHASAERMRREKLRADRESAQKTAFLAAASHDLRQPVHALGLLIGALEDRIQKLPVAQAAELTPLAEKIAASSRSVEEMLHGLLDLSKLDAEVVEARVEDFALAPLLEQLVQELAPLAEDKGLTLRSAATGVWVRSDPLLLRRILQNLVGNALRYTAQGRVVVGVRRERSGRGVRIEVRDTGPGIAPEAHRRIFDAYERASSAEEGLGLGLAIVSGLARLLDHPVSVASEAGRGACFRISLPRVPPRSVARAKAPVTPLEGRVIAVVDDDAGVVDGMSELLSGWGCEVLGAHSVASLQSVLSASGRTLDAIVADHRLAPNETGLDAIAAARELQPDCPALLISGDEAATPVGDIPLLRKPVLPFQLRAALASLVRRHAP